MSIDARRSHHYIIIKQQLGFRHGRQTLDNIILTSQKILEGFQRKEKSLSIFFDVASAFDKVWHKGLIFKCVNYGMPYYLVRIIKNYLEQRYFEVKNCHIRPWPINAGVPKGGVLSPTLFSIFINDIPIKNNDKFKEYSMLFADDSSYLITGKNILAD